MTRRILLDAVAASGLVATRTSVRTTSEPQGDAPRTTLGGVDDGAEALADDVRDITTPGFPDATPLDDATRFFPPHPEDMREVGKAVAQWHVKHPQSVEAPERFLADGPPIRSATERGREDDVCMPLGPISATRVRRPLPTPAAAWLRKRRRSYPEPGRKTLTGRSARWRRNAAATSGPKWG